MSRGIKVLSQGEATTGCPGVDVQYYEAMGSLCSNFTWPSAPCKLPFAILSSACCHLGKIALACSYHRTTELMCWKCFVIGLLKIISWLSLWNYTVLKLEGDLGGHPVQPLALDWPVIRTWKSIVKLFRPSLSFLMVLPCFVFLSLQLNSPMNPVSSTEDIKPPLGLNGVLKVPVHPSSAMASFTKHICAICGDRSSGNVTFAECLAEGWDIRIKSFYYPILVCSWHVKVGDWETLGTYL